MDPVIAVFLLFISGICLYSVHKNKKTIKLNKTFLLISRIAASICLLVAITMIADLAIPKQTLIVAAVKESNSRNVSFGIYKEDMTKYAYENIHDGEKLQIQVSRIYDEIKQITKINENNKIIKFPTVDCYAFLYMLIVLTIPGILIFKRTYKTENAKFFALYCGIFSIVFGFVGILILGKVFLVHVLHVLPIV